MIRWSYVFPRLILIGAVWLLLWFGINPLVRWVLISMGQSLTSAKVEIGALEASLLRGELRLSDVQVADPDSPLKNLLEARQLTLGLETDSLLQQKLIVTQARASGLQIGTDRKTSGALEPKAGGGISFSGGELVELGERKLAELGQRWLDHAAGALQQEVEKELEQLQSVQLAKQLAQRWPREYERMEARADALKQRIDALRRLFQSRTNNPLRDMDIHRQGGADLEAIQREMSQLRDDLQRLQQQALRDRDAIADAQQRDLQQIEQRLRLENLNAENLSEYLLGPELGQRVSTLAKWIHWGRRYLPGKSQQPQPDRGRGTDILFPGICRRPDFLIRWLALDGQGQFGQDRFEFQAAATGLTSQPEVYGQPAALRAQVTGSTAMWIEAVLDHTGKIPHDRIVVNCPGLAMPQRVLGRRDQLAVTVSPGSTHLWAAVDLRGEELAGQIVMRQEPVELVPDIAAQCGGRRLAANLQGALSQVRSIHVVVDLSGTLQKPDWKLSSNLGPQLAGALNWWIHRELAARRDELTARVRRQVEGELANFERLVLAKHQTVFGALQSGGIETHEIGQLIAQRFGLPDGILGRGIPAGLPLRF